LAVATVYWVWRGSQRWFTADDWYVLMYRDLGRGDLVEQLFRSQQGHPIVPTVVQFWVTTELFGWSSYLPYALVPLALHVASLVVLWALTRRAGVSELTSSAVVLVVAAFGRAVEFPVFGIISNYEYTLLGGVALLATAVYGVAMCDRDVGRRLVWPLCLSAGLIALVLGVQRAANGTGDAAIGRYVLVLAFPLAPAFGLAVEPAGSPPAESQQSAAPAHGTPPRATAQRKATVSPSTTAVSAVPTVTEVTQSRPLRICSWRSMRVWMESVPLSWKSRRSIASSLASTLLFIAPQCRCVTKSVSDITPSLQACGCLPRRHAVGGVPARSP